MVLNSSLYDLSYHSYVCPSAANIVIISPKLRFLDDHNSNNTQLMWVKFGVAKLLCICIDLTKFEENPEGLSFFCVDLTWNDPLAIWSSCHDSLSCKNRSAPKLVRWTIYAAKYGPPWTKFVDKNGPPLTTMVLQGWTILCCQKWSPMHTSKVRVKKNLFIRAAPYYVRDLYKEERNAVL